MSFYRSIVLVKQTPNTSTVTENALNADGTINRAALPTVLNPEDLNALEAALEVKDRFGGSVTVISMGPPQAAEILREALYRGADRAILICDRAVAGSDVLATSYILSQAIKKAGEFAPKLAKFSLDASSISSSAEDRRSTATRDRPVRNVRRDSAFLKFRTWFRSSTSTARRRPFAARQVPDGRP